MRSGRCCISLYLHKRCKYIGVHVDSNHGTLLVHFKYHHFQHPVRTIIIHITSRCRNFPYRKRKYMFATFNPKRYILSAWLRLTFDRYCMTFFQIQKTNGPETILHFWCCLALGCWVSSILNGLSCDVHWSCSLIWIVQFSFVPFTYSIIDWFCFCAPVTLPCIHQILLLGRLCRLYWSRSANSINFLVSMFIFEVQVERDSLW